MKRNHQTRRNEKGFTLVELALSLGITAFGLVSIMGMLPVGLTNFRLARQATFYSEMLQTLQSETGATKFATLQGTPAPYYFDGDGNLCAQAAAVYKIVAVPNSSYPANGINAQIQPNVLYFQFQLIYIPTSGILRQFPYFVGNSGN